MGTPALCPGVVGDWSSFAGGGGDWESFGGSLTNPSLDLRFFDHLTRLSARTEWRSTNLPKNAVGEGPVTGIALMSDALADIERGKRANSELAAVQSVDQLEQFRIKYLGSNG